MDILSKDTLALFEYEEFRKAINDLLNKPAGSSLTVPLGVTQPDRPESGDVSSQQKKTVTLRRLAV
jgi:hypothetical protein